METPDDDKFTKKTLSVFGIFFLLVIFCLGLVIQDIYEWIKISTELP